MPWQPAQVWPMTAPRAASPASVIGINGGGGEAGGALLCAKTEAPKAQIRAAKAADKERRTGGGSQEIPFSKARILAKSRARWQETFRFSEGCRPLRLLGPQRRNL